MLDKDFFRHYPLYPPKTIENLNFVVQKWEWKMQYIFFMHNRNNDRNFEKGKWFQANP